MPHSVACQTCGSMFHVKPRRVATARFCSWACRGYRASTAPKSARANVGSFRPGQTPWNAGTKGIRCNPATEFQKGHRGARTGNVGDVNIRTDHGNLRAFVKVAEPNVWKLRAVLAWEAVNGPLPDGWVVHHENRDTLDDSIGNLVACTRADHLREHHAELTAARRAAHKLRSCREHAEIAAERLRDVPTAEKAGTLALFREVG